MFFATPCIERYCIISRLLYVEKVEHTCTRQCFFSCTLFRTLDRSCVNGRLLFVDKGRAWLYQALSDHLLESYIRCYIDNEKLVKSFYMQDALVLDYQVL